MPPTDANPSPIPGDTYRDEGGVVRCMTVCDGYVMCRRARCMPFLISVKEWRNRAAVPVQLARVVQGEVTP